MRESYSFNIPKEENGIVPLSTAQDQAISSEKRMTQLLADDLRRFIRGEKGKHKWQLVDAAGKPTDLKAACAALAMDAKPKQRLASTQLPKNKAAQKRNNPVTPLARQQQSQQAKSALVDRLYGGKGSLEAKFWPST
ncbi:MAG: hypothetical protein GX673_11115 [Gammaproteobacteria bacterium]|nr:hypothetical protein [Gammaproteobacteria bacterium]